MRIKPLHIYIFAIFCYILQSCVYSPTKNKTLDCDAPINLCNPYKLTIPNFDSSNYTIQQIFTTPDINCSQIYFYEKDVFFTSNSPNQHSIYRANQLAFDKFNKFDKIVNENEIVGFPSVFGKIMFYAEYPDSAVYDKLGCQSYIVQINDFNSSHYRKISLDYLKASQYEWYGYPAISSDGQTLFFSSNRSGGYGGLDIWYSKIMNNGNWSEPINCGEFINTPCDEISPFIFGNSISFASSGLAGFGGYDLFKADIYKNESELRFSKATNYGPQINTNLNEMCLTINSNFDSIIYFARNELNSFRLYCRIPINMQKNPYITDSKKEKLNSEQKLLEQNKKANPIPNKIINQHYTYFGEVLSKSDNSTIPNARINISRNDIDSVVNLIADKKGRFNFRLKKGVGYSITAHSENYFYDMKQVNISTSDKTDSFEQQLYLPKIAILRINFPSDVFDKPYDFVLDTNGEITSILWQNEIQVASRDIKMALDKINEIIITGFTDTLNTESYNYQLGLKRANFVKSELIRNGIPAKLLKVKSMGENFISPKNNNESDAKWALRQRRVTISKVMIK